MKNINELIKEYEKIDDILQGAESFGQRNDYICDTVHEVADSEVSIYYSELLDWVKNDREAVDYIEDSVAEFGLPEKFDFYKMLQAGQYLQNEHKIYDNLDAFCKIWVLAYLRDTEKLTEISDEQADKIDELTADNNSKFDELLEQIKND